MREKRKITFWNVSFFILGSAVLTFSFFEFWGVSWKEEVLLHDGRKIIVKRSQSYGGMHEIGQTPPIKKQNITFTVPETNKTITWKSEYSEDIGRANFELLALHILDGTPYIVASPNLCLSYNKWGRPNPPYVFFKFDGKTWVRIQLHDFPVEFKDINLVIDTKNEEKTFTAQPFVSAELVKKLNGSLTQPEYKTILREPLTGKIDCGEMIYDGKRGWIGLGLFRAQSSYEACLTVCKQEGMIPPYCPCDRLFNKNDKERQ